MGSVSILDFSGFLCILFLNHQLKCLFFSCLSFYFLDMVAVIMACFFSFSFLGKNSLTFIEISSSELDKKVNRSVR